MRVLGKRLVGIPILLAGLAALVAVFSSTGTALADGGSFLSHHQNVNTLSTTVPQTGAGAGDQNPYGVAVVPDSIGRLVKGHVLVSNFNNASNQQGTGTTIVDISPNGTFSVFARLNPATLPGACPGGVGLTTALVVLQRGWVIVGSLPAAKGVPINAKAGCLIVLNSWGRAVETFSGDGINGPWDMTAFEQGDDAALFVTNVLNGTVAANQNQLDQQVDKGTVLRINLEVPNQGHGIPYRTATTVIGFGFPQTLDPSALVIGPTGVGLGWDGTLYVANSLNNEIDAIPHALTRRNSAGTGKTVSANGLLNDPLGLTIAPNGTILTANGNDGNLVETTPGGKQIDSKLVDDTVVPGSAPGAGCLFGLAIIPRNAGVYFVDDCTNTLNTLT